MNYKKILFYLPVIASLLAASLLSGAVPPVRAQNEEPQAASTVYLPVIQRPGPVTLTYLAGSGGTLTGDTSQTFSYGGTGTPVTAVPNTGYQFTGWSDGRTDNPRTDTNVYMDITVTANFSVALYTGKIVFEGALTNNDNEIYIMNADGSGLTNLTNNPEAEDKHPSISTNSSIIGFQSNRHDVTDWDVFTMNPDGSQVRNRTSDPNHDDGAAQVSPNGTRLVYVSMVANNGVLNSEIYVVDMDGSDKLRLTKNLFNDFAPSWSSDGTKIVFASDRHHELDGDTEIYIMDADGTDVVRLTNGKTDRRNPVFVPGNNNQVVFQEERAKNYDLMVVNSDGTGYNALTNTTWGEFEPAFSPDGKYIVFASDEFEFRQLMIMEFATHNIVKTFTLPADLHIKNVYYPDWGQ